MEVGTGSITVGADSLSTTVPLAMLGSASGRLHYRVFAYASSQPTEPTVVSDVLPDINLPTAHVP